MKNQKVPTWLGVIVIVTLAITVSFFVWQTNKKCNVTDNYNQGQQNEQKSINKKIKINTNDWKICESKKYGYQFKYPTNWNIHVPVNTIITDCSEQTSLVIISSLPEESLQRVTFSLVKNAPTLEEFVSQNKAKIKIEKELTINGKKALIYKEDGPRGEIQFINIFNNGTSYGLTAEGLSSDALFKAFVSTFKLIN